ncbi:MAG: hypothetical protein KAI64_03935 [Thermoplasmata archaeon]|nr:hypothetical protein [Thermoplasmata archaeon]
MNPKNILEALKEKSRWEKRKERLAEELKYVRDEEIRVSDELAVAKEEIARLDEAFAILSSGNKVSSPSPMDIGAIR